MGQEEAALMPAATVFFSWEPATAAAEARGMPPETPKKAPPPPPPARRLSVPPETTKKAPPALRLSVPPPPGRPSTTTAAAPVRSFSRGRAVRPEDDPFLAAYLACTKSRKGAVDGGGAASAPSREPKDRRRFTWAGLGLSCKSSAGAVEQSMVKLAKRPELDPRDA